jgi:hypothetical protein
MVKRMKLRIKISIAVCLACFLAIAGFPAVGYNSLNESAESAQSLNIHEFESLEANEIGINYSDFLNKTPQEKANNTTSMLGSVDVSHPNRPCLLQIVDYWGYYYPCNAKCVFLNDIARMVITTCSGGYLKLYEEYPDTKVVESRYIPVSANRKYNWWFIGDVEGIHTLKFEIVDRYGTVHKSNTVEFQVIPQNCPDIENCMPSRYKTVVD